MSGQISERIVTAIMAFMVLMLVGCGTPENGAAVDSVAPGIDAVVTGIQDESIAVNDEAGSQALIESDSTASSSPIVVANDVVVKSETGSVMMLLTDAPNSEFSEINLTITKLELLGGEQGSATLFSGWRKIDLLSLRSFSNLFSMSSDVAPGIYHKIRMRLDDIELVRRDAAGEIIETIHPKLVANGKLDFNPRGEFVVAPGKSLVIQLDMDAEKSLHLVKTGGGNGKKPAGKGKNEYIFRPVVFIDIVDMVDYGGKLVRVEGDVNSIDPQTQSVKVCNLKNFDGAECVLVSLNGATTVYDENGELITLDQLQNLERGIAIGYMNIENGQGYMNAVALELGPVRAFFHVKGDVTRPPVDDSNLFYFSIDPGQSFIAGTEFRVLPAQGAKLFSSQGELLPWSAVTTGRIVEIEGVLDRRAVEGYTFEATVVYLDMSQAAEQLAGEVSNLDLTAMSFDVTTAELGDRCVVAAENVSLYMVSGGQDGLSGSRINFSAVQNGDSVDLYGAFGSGGCFIADDILVTTM